MIFRMRYLSIIFIRPNDATSAISRNSVNVTFFTRAQSCSLICSRSREPSFWNFRELSFPILFIWRNAVTGAILHNSVIVTFFTHALALVNLSLLPGDVLFEYSRASTLNFIYFAQ